MNFPKILLVGITTAILISMIAITTFASNDPVDWNSGVIRVTGNGVGKAAYKESSPGQYRLTARQAARMDAQRKLAEYAEGVMVTGNSSMHDFALEDDRVETALKNVLLKNAMEIGEPHYTEDGVCKVTMEIRLFGGTGSLSEAAFIPYKDEPKVSFPDPIDKAVTKQPTVVKKNYTGLIIDCHGLGTVNPVMSPVIKNADGTKIYGHQNLDYDKIIINGMASYANNTHDQISRARAGDNPLIIKAIELSDHNANPIVSIADADKILAANQHDKFLDNCAVVFVK